jgi:cytochrome b6-f complex iron-sulfur subunit
MSQTKMTRRDFLKLTQNALLAVCGLVGLGGVLRYLSYPAQPPAKTEFDLGLASDYAPGSRTVLVDVPAVLIHIQAGFSALSLVCPHLGCTVNMTSDGFTCPCHGSRFLPDGSLRNGPASHPLTVLRVEVNSEGHLILYTG